MLVPEHKTRRHFCLLAYIYIINKVYSYFPNAFSFDLILST